MRAKGGGDSAPTRPEASDAGGKTACRRDDADRSDPRPDRGQEGTAPVVACP